MLHYTYFIFNDISEVCTSDFKQQLLHNFLFWQYQFKKGKLYKKSLLFVTFNNSYYGYFRSISFIISF